APSRDLPEPVVAQLDQYLAVMYANYASVFGNEDVTVSMIAPRGPSDADDGLQHLIAIFDSTGIGQPNWFEVHIGYSHDEALYGRERLDATRQANGLSQPVVVGETAYNSRDVAKAILSFLGSSQLDVEEVIEWFSTKKSGCALSPPYSVAAYVETLSS